MSETLSLDIAQPPASVYAVLVDQDTWAALDPALLEITPRGSVAVGMSGTMRRRVAGRRVTNGWTVTELEPGARVGMRLTGAGYELIETTTLEATAGGTRAMIIDTLRPTSLTGRVFVTVSGPFIRRDLRAQSERLKVLLEATPATCPPGPPKTRLQQRRPGVPTSSGSGGRHDAACSVSARRVRHCSQPDPPTSGASRLEQVPVVSMPDVPGDERRRRSRYAGS
jgi:hypothetical protein